MTRAIKDGSSASRFDPKNADILDWRWPVAPVRIQLHDKYSGMDYVIRADEESWSFTYKGGSPRPIIFAQGRTGTLQRTLALLTSARKSPAVLHRTARMLVNHWSVVAMFLQTDPSELRRNWDQDVTKVDLAAALKAVLKFACSACVGPWSDKALPMVTSMNTLANPTVARNVSAIENRENLVSTDLQAAIVKVLDAASENATLSAAHQDGAAILALTYQHGVRPVQALSLNVSDISLFHDAANELTCVVSFHAAKQPDGKTFEILRQVKQEWVPIIERLCAMAREAGRSRLFDGTSSSTVWSRAKQLCAASGVSLRCTAPQLRHTAAQALADTGHSRKSIQDFLGHATHTAAAVYIKASMHQAQLVNSALGASKLYSRIRQIASNEFITNEDVLEADEDMQIGGIVGDTLIAGIGLCKTGQSKCAFNPVTSCYGCRKFMPSIEKDVHLDAVEGMRQQVRAYLERGVPEENPAYRQLTRALSGAQQAIHGIDGLGGVGQ